MSQNLLEKSVEEVAHLVESKEISPVELTQKVLNHAESVNEKVNAYVRFFREQAEDAAKKAEEEIMQGNYRGMYHGIPIGIKDNIYVKGEKVTMGSKIHQDFIPKEDAAVIKNLREAGAIFIGMLNMHEYAWGITNNNPHYGPSRNPWNLDKITGGSSGGSGAAVATNMAFAALGTDTGGSIRIPSSACGIFGIKPTYGRVSNEGCFPLASTLDHIGPMTKTVKDAAALLDILAEDSTHFYKQVDEPLDLKNLVIGIHEDYFFTNIDQEIERAVRTEIKRLEDQGAKVQAIDLPSIQEVRWAQTVILRSEFAHVHRENRKQRPTDFGLDIQEQIKEPLPSAADYLHALDIRGRIQAECKELFETIDVIMAPTLSIMPPNIGDEVTFLKGEEVSVFEYILRLTNFSNTTGLPALSIPCGFKDGMPIGLQIIGPYFEEGKILQLAHLIERENDAIRQRKPLVTFT